MYMCLNNKDNSNHFSVKESLLQIEIVRLFIHFVGCLEILTSDLYKFYLNALLCSSELPTLFFHPYFSTSKLELSKTDTITVTEASAVQSACSTNHFMQASQSQHDMNRAICNQSTGSFCKSKAVQITAKII